MAHIEGMRVPMDASVSCEPVRVFFLIENRLLREALVRLFRKRPDFTVVGQSGERDLTIRRCFKQIAAQTPKEALTQGIFPGLTLRCVSSSWSLWWPRA